MKKAFLPMTASLGFLAKQVKCKVTDGALKPYTTQDEWQQKANSFRVQLAYQGRRMSLDFWQGTGITEAPTAAGVLDCLLSDASSASESFEDWCGNYGYDTDSRKALASYNQVKKQAVVLKKLLGDDFEMFMDSEKE